MAATIQLYTHFNVTVNGVLHEGGSLRIPDSISIGGEVDPITATIAVSTTVNLLDLDATGDILGDFDFLWIQTDFDLMLELITDTNDGIGDEPYTVGLLGSGTALKYGPPFILARDDSYANYTKNFGGGTLDVIDNVRVKNLSSTQVANLYMLAAT